MSSQRKPRTQRYSAQIRASQYDPDVDVNHYNHQFNMLQQQQHPQLHHPQPQSTISPRVSMDMSMHPSAALPTPAQIQPLNSQDHYPVSSSSNSTATTFINLTNPDSPSNNAPSDSPAAASKADPIAGRVPGQASPSPSQSSPALNSTTSTSSSNGATANGLTSTETTTSSTPPRPLNATSLTAQLLQQPPPPLNSSPTPPQASAPSSSSRSPFSIFSANKKSSTPSRRRSKTDAPQPSKKQSQKSSSIPPRSFADGQNQFQHAKTASVASVRSRLVARTSRSSLQLNLRTNQDNPNPTLIPTPSQSPGGTWDGPNLAPSPFYPNMDPAFLQEQQLASGGGNGRADSPGYNKENTRNGNNNNGYSNSRQDDGRLQLEQARAYYKSRKCLTWTRSKLLLLLANTILLGYAVTCTVVVTMSWRGDPWTKPYLDSGIMMIANHNVLFLMMATAPFGIFVALTGYIGIFSQSRKVLTLYNVLLWPLFAMITSIGYICYRRSHLALYQKLKFSWINEYSRDDRLVIQNALNCCGYRSLSDYPSYDLHCFPRAPLPSCEAKFLQYQQDLLSNTSSAAFTLLPIQLLVMIVALLCSNHIDNLYRTAYPITPKLYTQ